MLRRRVLKWSLPITFIKAKQNKTKQNKTKQNKIIKASSSKYLSPVESETDTNKTFRKNEKPTETKRKDKTFLHNILKFWRKKTHICFITWSISGAWFIGEIIGWFFTSFDFFCAGELISNLSLASEIANDLFSYASETSIEVWGGGFCFLSFVFDKTNKK